MMSNKLWNRTGGMILVDYGCVAGSEVRVKARRVSSLWRKGGYC